MGSSYLLPVRLSTTESVSFGTADVLDCGSRKDNRLLAMGYWATVAGERMANSQWLSYLASRGSTTPQSLSDPLQRGGPARSSARGVREPPPAEMDPDFQPGMNLLEKLQAAIDESRARVKQDLVLYRTQRPVKKLEGRTAVIVDGQIVYPWKALAAAKAVEGLGAREVVIATPVAAQPAADRIRARQYPLVCPSVVMEQEGHPSPYGDAGADAPERLKSIMIAHQAA